MVGKEGNAASVLGERSADEDFLLFMIVARLRG
jgi:hypothetical protein